MPPTPTATAVNHSSAAGFSQVQPPVAQVSRPVAGLLSPFLLYWKQQIKGGSAMELGERLYQLRRERRMSQEALADALGVSRQSVSKWENGVSHS